MKWIASKTTMACARQPLAQLLADQLDEQQAARVTEHLDRCEECQRRITKLSAEPNWWREAGQWLENASIDEDLAEEWFGEEFGEHHGPSPETCLIQSGLMRPSTKLEMIGSIGRYDVRRVIGTGGTGIVLQAVDTELDRVVAVKVLSLAFAGNGPARRRFAREGQPVAAVVHENVVTIHHVESDGPVPFLVMHFVDGCSLQEQIIRLGPMDAIATLRIIAQLASALDAAHAQGLVHRDVKPANILVGTTGQRVWVTDFGLARAVDDASLTRTGFIAGTPHYMSPEQARGESVGPGSDLFGLRSVMYFLLTGRPPFRAERSLAILNRICNEKHRPVREVNSDVPVTVANIVDRLLEKDSRIRYQSASDVRDECLKLLSHPESIDESPKPPVIRKKPRHVSVKVLLSFLAISLTGIGLVKWNWQNTKSYAMSSEAADRSESLEKTFLAFQKKRNRIRSRTSELVNDDRTQPTVESNVLVSPSLQVPQAGAFQSPHLLVDNSPVDISTINASRDIAPSEQQLWQTEFDALDRGFQILQASWILQSSQPALESLVDSAQVSFEQHVSQLKELFDHLESPAYEPSQNAPRATY